MRSTRSASLTRGGNVLGERGLAIDAEGCLIRSDGPLVATIGVKDLIVIATADAVVVVPRGESQRVKEAVEMIRKGQAVDEPSPL